MSPTRDHKRDIAPLRVDPADLADAQAGWGHRARESRALRSTGCQSRPSVGDAWRGFMASRIPASTRNRVLERLFDLPSLGRAAARSAIRRHSGDEGEPGE